MKDRHRSNLPSFPALALFAAAIGAVAVGAFAIRRAGHWAAGDPPCPNWQRCNRIP
jgi:hypothetical protein